MSQAINILFRNNVKVFGRGPQILMFAHGFGADQNTWNTLTPFLENDFRLVLFDYVGAGKSDLTAYTDERYGALAGYAADVIDICKELSLENIVFIGHSVSCMIGLLAAKQAPSFFSKLIFIGPSPRYINDGDYYGGMEESDLEDLLTVMDNNYLGWSRSLAPAIVGNEDRPELGESLAESFCTTDPEIAKKFARVIFYSDNRKDLPSLAIPSLTLQAKNDVLTSERVARYIHEHSQGNELILLDSSGHCPHLSDPETVAKAIKTFVKSS